MIKLEDALNAIRLNKGVNDAVVQSMLDAIPAYIEEQTGMGADQQEQEPLVVPATYIILDMWYNADYNANAVNALNSLLRAISLKVTA